ncbi:hypothetical protein HK104_002078 [Borealophlyctis nickersoniae]|nr:hypothetical protein HK104_002078 [Borealophlyctis nickersoniae]
MHMNTSQSSIGSIPGYGDDVEGIRMFEESEGGRRSYGGIGKLSKSSGKRLYRSPSVASTSPDFSFHPQRTISNAERPILPHQLHLPTDWNNENPQDGAKARRLDGITQVNNVLRHSIASICTTILYSDDCTVADISP